MKMLLQLVRQPLKLIAGLLVAAFASSILCVCIGQAVATDMTREEIEYNFTTIALTTTKYNFSTTYETDENGNSLPLVTWNALLPSQIDDLINNIVQTRGDLVKLVAAPGLASAYLPELVFDNLTEHTYYYPYAGSFEDIATHKLEGEVNYACAMLEVELTEIGEPSVNTTEGIKEDGTETSLVTSVKVEVRGIIRQVVSMEEGYADPTGRVIYVTLNLPDVESLAMADLEIGGRYLIYGDDYVDEDWEMQGLALTDPSGLIPTSFFFAGVKSDMQGASALTVRDGSAFGSVSYVVHESGRY
ncbi:MAG: hypothetical protein LUJ09_02285, partial [Firmicutes bacterium]|nr:hypothetical protein [Bacillota bacterium]